MKKIVIIHKKGKRDDSVKRIQDYLILTHNAECVLIEPCELGVFVPNNGDNKLFCGLDYVPDILYSYYNNGDKGVNTKFVYAISELVSKINITCIPAFLNERKSWNTKPHQIARFKQSGLPVLDSFICLPKFLHINKNIEIVEECIKYPMVVKGDGDNGVAVWKIMDRDALLELVRVNADKFSIVLIQKYLHVEQDIKVIATQNSVIASIERRSEDFLKNISAGGSGHQIELTDYEKQISMKVVQALGRDASGLDLLRGEGGVYISEANRFFNVKVIEEVSENNRVIEDIVDSLFGDLNKK
jgi:glutathione synthase/RimK-type ligase-like ATP-grasp enzyme